MTALHKLDGDIDIRCMEYGGNACDEIQNVRGDSKIYDLASRSGVNDYFQIVFDELRKRTTKFLQLNAKGEAVVDPDEQALLHIWDFAENRYVLNKNKPAKKHFRYDDPASDRVLISNQ